MNKEQKIHDEMMRMKVNNATMDIIRAIKVQGLDPQATIVSIVKASAVLIEGYASIGGDADSLEMMMKEMIGPARKEAKRMMFKDAKGIFNN